MNLRVVVRVIAEDGQGRMLLVRNEGADFWYPPGGGLRIGESLPGCAKREFLEETGMEVDVGPLVYVQEFHPLGKDRVDLEFFFLAPYPNRLVGDPTNTGAVAERRWYVLDEIQGLAVFPEQLKRGEWRRETSHAVYLGVVREEKR